MLEGILTLLTLQLIGELISRFFQLPVPGPVLGMMLLAVTLLVHQRVPAGLRSFAEGLLKHLPFLFVPAGVGLMLHMELLKREGLLILIALIGSSTLAIVITALLFKTLANLKGRQPHE